MADILYVWKTSHFLQTFLSFFLATILAFINPKDHQVEFDKIHVWEKWKKIWTYLHTHVFGEAWVIALTEAIYLHFSYWYIYYSTDFSTYWLDKKWKSAELWPSGNEKVLYNYIAFISKLHYLILEVKLIFIRNFSSYCITNIGQIKTVSSYFTFSFLVQ